MSTQPESTPGQGRIQIDNLLTTGLVPVTFAGSTVVGDRFQVEVWAGDTRIGSGAMYPHQDGPRAGRFNLGQVGVPGTAPGETAQLQVRVWDGTTGSSFESATVKGASSWFQTLPLGGPNPAGGPDLFPPKLDGFQSFSLGSNG